jgi:AcrR family transcriptional regulator
MKTTEKQDRKEQLIEAAERLFNERGYLATGMRDLAEAMGLEAASLYSHTKSKEDLLWTIATRCSDEFFAAVRPITQTPLHTKMKLREMMIAHVQVIIANQKASAVFLHEWQHLGAERKAEYAAIRNEYEDLFRNVVQQGIAENLFKNHDNRFTTRAILSALNWTYTWYRADGDMKPDEIGRKLADLLLDGLVRSI